MILSNMKEGLFLVPAVFEPFQGDVGNGVGGVFAIIFDGIFLPWLIATNPEFGIEVGPLPGEDGVVVEVRGFVLEMPFADHRGVIPGLTELNGEGLLSGRDPPGEVESSVGVVVLSGQDAGPGRRADRVGAEGVGEEGALLGKAVDRRGRGDFGKATVVGGNPMCGMIIGHDEKDVGLGLVGLVMVSQRQGWQQGKQEKSFRHRGESV